MGEEQSLEYRTVSGGDSRSSETPVTHIGPFVENEEKPKKKKKSSQSWSRSQPKITSWHVQPWLIFCFTEVCSH